MPTEYASGEVATGRPNEDAKERALAIRLGAKWKCSRVRKWVDLDECVARYADAKSKGEYSPCVECASIVRHLRQIGTGVVVNTKPPKPLPEPEPTTEIKEAAVAKPAKKGTPDPIMDEVKAAAETRLEIVEKAGKPDDVNPFAGWVKFNPRDQIKPGDVYVRIGKTSMTMSAAAADGLGLNQYDTVDVYHADGKLGLHFRKGKGGTFVLTKETRGGKVRKMSCASLVKNLKLKEIGAMGRRLPLKEIAPGMIEVQLAQECAA